jgi:hypothetical protein
MSKSAATQPFGAAALKEAQIGSMIDPTGKVGVFIIDANPERVGRGRGQGVAPEIGGDKRRFLRDLVNRYGAICARGAFLGWLR